MNGQGNGLKSGLNARLEELSPAAKVQDEAMGTIWNRNFCLKLGKFLL